MRVGKGNQGCFVCLMLRCGVCEVSWGIRLLWSVMRNVCTRMVNFPLVLSVWYWNQIKFEIYRKKLLYGATLPTVGFQKSRTPKWRGQEMEQYVIQGQIHPQCTHIDLWRHASCLMPVQNMTVSWILKTCRNEPAYVQKSFSIFSRKLGNRGWMEAPSFPSPALQLPLSSAGYGALACSCSRHCVQT